MRISREFADLAAAAALSALLFLTGALVPLFGPPAGFFSAAPLIWAAARFSGPVGLLGAALATAVLLPILPPPATLVFALEHAVPAWYLGRRLAHGRGIVGGSAVAALAVTALLLGTAALLAQSGDRDPVKILESQLRTAFAELGAGADTPALPPNFEEVMALLRRVLPALTLVGVFLECALNSLLALRFLLRRGAPLRAPDLTGFALPEHLVWLLILALALTWAPQPALSTLALNLLIPLLLAYLLQGLSILLHFAGRARLGPLAKLLTVLSFAVAPWLLLVPVLVGALDFRVGFRARWPLPPPAA